MNTEGFLHEYRQVRNNKPLSPRSKRVYREYLERLDGYLREHGFTFPNLTKNQFSQFLDEQPWGSSSRYNALAAAKAYRRWGTDDDPDDDHPLVKHSLPRDPTGPLPTPKKAQLDKLFKSFDLRTILAIRAYLAALLAQETGLRANEIATIKRDDVDLENLEFRIVVKGGFEWITPFPESVRDAVKRWLPARDRLAQDGVDTLFVALKGTRRIDGKYVSAVGYPLTRHGVKLMFYRMTEKAGIGRYSPHAFRRSFCTDAVERNVNLRLIQMQGRWRSMRMVELYSKTASPQAFRGHFGGFGEQ